MNISDLDFISDYCEWCGSEPDIVRVDFEKDEIIVSCEDCDEVQ
jgi:hypothetical protein